MTLPNSYNGLQNMSHKPRLARDKVFNQQCQSGRPGHAGLNSVAVQQFSGLPHWAY